jgi:hypothetical protein
MREANRPSNVTRAQDDSENQTVVEYAAQEMFKGKSPAIAAKITAEKLSGHENMFVRPGSPVAIDARRLEDALWSRLADFTIDAMGKLRVGKEHYALDGTAQHFRQRGKGFRAELKKRVIQKMGANPFQNDDVLSEEHEMREASLTPDILPYRGYGIQSDGEYKATLAFLRAVDKNEDVWKFLGADIASNEYMGALAALRGGLVQQSGHDRTGPYFLTSYGRVYLKQRERGTGLRETSGAEVVSVGEMSEAAAVTDSQIIDYFIFDAEDKDVGLFSRASTDEVATHFGIDPDAAYRLLNKTRGLTKSRDTLRGKNGKKAVGFQLWEYYWKPGDLERFDAK